MCGIYEAIFYIALAMLSAGIAFTVVMFAMALLGRQLYFYPLLLLIIGSGGLIGSTLGLSMIDCPSFPIPLRWLGM